MGCVCSSNCLPTIPNQVYYTSLTPLLSMEGSYNVKKCTCAVHRNKFCLMLHSYLRIHQYKTMMIYLAKGVKI